MTRRPKLTKKTVEQIRREYVPYVNGTIRLGRKYGVAQSTIRDIVTYRTWKHARG